MLAVVFDAPGDADVLRVGDVPAIAASDLAAGELLVRVRATAVNRADVMQRRGLYPPPPGASSLLGLELAGEVAAIGAGVTGFVIGDRVCGIVAGGAYAELARLHAGSAMRIPDAMTFEQAAAFPEVWLTAYDALFLRGHLQRGERALIHGGGSGIGTAAIQLAVRAGAEAIVTVGSDEKGERCLALGASRFINYKREQFATMLADQIDVILDIMGAAYLDANLRALRLEGRMVIIGMQGGIRAELDLMRLLYRRITICGSTLRARTADEKAALTARVAAEVLPAIADGSLQVVIDRVMSIRDVAAAHQRLESSDHVGKIVLSVP